MLFISKLRKKLRRVREDEMAKRKKKVGKSVRHGNLPSPYTKYGKKPYPYGTDYKKNYLKGGVLFRDGKPYVRKQDQQLEAAE